MYPRICIQPSISSGKPTPATWSQIELAMRQPAVQEICDQIKLLDGKDPDELSRLKKRLPVITPHACRFRGDGTRKSENAIPSGLVMLDIDHIDDPREFFSTHIFPHLGRLINNNKDNINDNTDNLRPNQHPLGAQGEYSSPRQEVDCRGTLSKLSSNKNIVDNNAPCIYFVAITPSGHGLRIIAERNPGESIPEAQMRVAAACNLPEFDAVTKDLARASFIMPWSYVLYCEPAGLNFDTPEKEATVTTHFAQVESKNYTTTLLQEKKSSTPANINTTKETPTDYRGTPYADIVRELVNLLGGEPAMGERNQFYFTLVRYMRYICNFDPDMCVRVLPDFGLSLSERCSTALSSVNRPRKGDIPDLLNRAITTAQQTNSEGEAPASSLIASSPDSLPALPRVLELICRRIPESYRPAMVIAALPILGALATRVRFQYLDKQEHSFSFMSSVSFTFYKFKECFHSFKLFECLESVFDNFHIRKTKFCARFETHIWSERFVVFGVANSVNSELMFGILVSVFIHARTNNFSLNYKLFPHFFVERFQFIENIVFLCNIPVKISFFFLEFKIS